MNFYQIKKNLLKLQMNFLEFIKDKKIIIHNAEFDIAHLNNELSLIGKNKINKDLVIDTLEIAREKFPGAGISLDALCKRYNIDNSRRNKHTAIIDCELLSKVYINLTDQKEPKLNFFKEEIIKDGDSNSSIDYSKKIVELTDSEISNHINFLKKNLKKNFF